MKFRKKPTTIDAWQVTTELPPAWIKVSPHVDGLILDVNDQLGFVKFGDWIALHVNGDVEVIAKDLFNLLYEFTGIES